MSAPSQTNRRKLLHGVLRYTAAVGIAGTSSAVVLKSRRLLKDGRCINRGVCKRCIQLVDCGLPRARSYRQAGKD